MGILKPCSQCSTTTMPPNLTSSTVLLLRSLQFPNVILTPQTFQSIPSPPIFHAPFSQAFSSFQLPSAADISDLIRKSKTSTCQLDPLPTSLVTACLPSLLPLITAIIHSSLTSGSVPSTLKSAAVTPILKKPGSDQ